MMWGSWFVGDALTKIKREMVKRSPRTLMALPAFLLSLSSMVVHDGQLVVATGGEDRAKAMSSTAVRFPASTEQRSSTSLVLK